MAPHSTLTHLIYLASANEVTIVRDREVVITRTMMPCALLLRRHGRPNITFGTYLHFV